MNEERTNGVGLHKSSSPLPAASGCFFIRQKRSGEACAASPRRQRHYPTKTNTPPPISVTQFWLAWQAMKHTYSRLHPPPPPPPSVTSWLAGSRRGRQPGKRTRKPWLSWRRCFDSGDIKHDDCACLLTGLCKNGLHYSEVKIKRHEWTNEKKADPCIADLRSPPYDK